MLILPDMMSWQHFVQLPQIRNLSLHEQTQRYNYYLMEQQALITQVMAQQAVGSGGSTTSTPSGPTPITLAFEISSESGTNVLLQIGTKLGKSVDATVEWDAVGLVSAGSVSETIAPNTTWSPSIDLEEGDTNVPLRIILSDSSAIQLITWTASNDDVNINEYQIWTAPTNFSELIDTNLIQFEFQGVSELDISNFEGTQFDWVNDVTITSANLTNVNANSVSFRNCTSLSTLTLTGLTYGNNVDGGYELDFFGCALGQSTIVALLEAADASGYENGIIDVSNGTNFEFNGGDYTAIEPTILSLEGKGWTLYIN